MKTELLTPKEVETLFKIKTGTLANWRSQGKGPQYHKIGRTVRYKRNDVEEWIESNLVLTTDII